MSNVTGPVEAMSKDNKRLMVAGVWYGNFNPLNGINRGDVVSFDFIKKGQWNNIKGGVEVITSGGNPSQGHSGPAVAHSPAEAPSPAHYERNAGWLIKSFPVPANHPDRSIIRQNSVTNAIRLLEASKEIDELSIMSNDDLIHQVLDIATKLEKYSTGDLELEMAKAMMAEKPEGN